LNRNGGARVDMSEQEQASSDRLEKKENRGEKR